MRLERLAIPEVVKITPMRLGDHRGYFSEVYKDQWFRENVADVAFVQDNESVSALAGTIRGLHFQTAPYAQNKLVRCISGGIFDVAVDVRSGSPTFGKWVGAELSSENGEQLWIPAGFAHGFVTLTSNSKISYKVTAPYSAENDCGVLWNDPQIGIVWPVDLADVVLSDKDRLQPKLAELPPSFEYFPPMES